MQQQSAPQMNPDPSFADARPVSSYSEWQPLREVIVGRGETYFRHHVDESFVLFFLENIYPLLGHGRRQALHEAQHVPHRYIEISKRVLDELTEDVDLLCEALTAEGVAVLRPDSLAGSSLGTIRTPDWTSEPTPALNVRDLTVILGDTIVETCTHVRARLFENDALKSIFYRYFRAGSHWVSMPKPRLNSGSLDPSYYRGTDLETVHETYLHSIGSAGQSRDNRFEIIFDGAQCMRLGEDVLVNVANRNHDQAFQWLCKQFSGNFTFHKIDRMADNHIDSVVLPLRPGLLLLRHGKYRAMLPEQLRGWDVVEFPEIDAPSPTMPADPTDYCLASPYLDMNVLSIDEKTVVANALCPALIKRLEAAGLTVIPVRHRHGRLFSGGFHCFTLDTVREGGKEKYI